MTPEKPTIKFILGQISFHDEGRKWYSAHDQPMMAEWSKGIAEEWRLKLATLYPQALTPQDGGKYVN